MMRPRRVLFAVVLTTSACNAILGNDDIRYTNAPGPQLDGAALDAEAGPAIDAPASDVSADVIDAGQSCDAFFCADFDPPLDQAPWGWSRVMPSPSFFAADPTASTTPPNGIVVTAQAPNSDRLLTLDLDHAGTSRWDFDFQIAQLPLMDGGTAYADIFQLQCDAQEKVQVRLFSSESFFGLALVYEGADAAANDSVVSSFAPTVATWAHLSVTATASGASLSTNGETPIAFSHGCASPKWAELGLASVSTGFWRLRFDRVRLTY